MKDLKEDPFGKFNGREQEYVIQALDSSLDYEKSFNLRFEEAFCKKFSCDYAIACNSGTSGLHAAVFAAGIKHGDEIIGPGLTVVMDAWAMIHLGATPVFADVNSQTMTIDPEDIERKITPKTKAILVVHRYGQMPDMGEFIRIAKKHNLLLIEDAAQAFCSSLNKKRAGNFSHAAGFSMNPMKILHAYGEAGAVVTNNKKKIDLLKQLRHAGTKRYLNKNYHINKCNHISLNHKMDTIQASFLIEEINRMNKIKLKRDKLSDYYDNTLPHLGCNPQRIFNNEIHGRYYYMFICNKRNELLKYLTSMKIECKIFYSPLTCDVEVHKTNNVRAETFLYFCIKYIL